MCRWAVLTRTPLKLVVLKGADGGGMNTGCANDERPTGIVAVICQRPAGDEGPPSCCWPGSIIAIGTAPAPNMCLMCPGMYGVLLLHAHVGCCDWLEPA